MAVKHRPISPRSRTSLLSRLLVPVAIAGLLFVGLAIYTVVNGELRLPFGGGVLFAFQKEEPKQTAKGTPAGTVAVLACPRNLPAYTMITQDHFYTKDGLHTVAVVPEAVEANRLFPANADGVKRLVGRVLRRNKSTNYAFTERDFLPVGTRPGPSAGIPPGKRGMWIDLATVQGLADARAGDRVDIVAAIELKTRPALDTSVLGNLADPVAKAKLTSVANRGANTPQASSWVVARRALVIQPRRSRSASPGKKRGGSSIEEVFVAMAPDEVASFSQALAQGVTLVAAPRSGQPDATTTEIHDSKPEDVNDELRRMLTGDDEQQSFGMVEVIRGGERHTITVPRNQADRETIKR